ncbi:MAG: cell division protein SepF [Ruminococcaceae bacterium]|nr:cell division protein SepF [Oscillospiraceae bacterium]
MEIRMGLMDRIKKVTGTNDAYDEAYDEDYYKGFDGYEDEEDDSDMQIAGGAMGGMGAPMQNPMGGGLSLSGNNIQMQVVCPQTFDSAPQIADRLLNKCTVVLNLENTNKETSRRLIDFLTGVAYSIDGSIKKVATNAYVITPSNVNVDDAHLKSTAAPRKKEEKPAEEAEAEFDDFN